MLKWDYVDTTSGALFYEERKERFIVSADETQIHFKRKNYVIINKEYTEDKITYKTECIRHTGKKHIKYETMFVVTPQAVGYCESLFVEV